MMLLSMLGAISLTVTWKSPLTEALQCTEYSHSDCSGDPNAVIFSINTSRDKCQQYCHITDECLFYRYNAKPVQGITCSLYKEPFTTFGSHCNLRSGPPHEDPTACQKPTEGSCEVVQSGLCIFYGISVETFDLPNMEDCEVLCLITPGCKYWIYRKEQQFCELLDSADKDCNEIFGPPSLSISACGIEGEETTTTLSSHPTPQDPIECPPTGLETFPDPDDCGSYWECFNGVLTHMSCGYCFLYDSNTKACDMSGRVDCGSRPVDVTCQASPAPGPCPYPNGYFKVPYNCKMYYFCADDNISEHTCETKEQDGKEVQLLYNYDNMWCDWDYRVSCEDRPICQDRNTACQCQGAEPADYTNPCRDFAGDPITHIGDPFNCSQSLICEDYVVKERVPCPPDQYYNEKMEDCEANEAVCELRPICTEEEGEQRCRCQTSRP